MKHVEVHHIHFEHKGLYYVLQDDMKKIKTLNQLIKTLIKFKKEVENEKI